MAEAWKILGLGKLQSSLTPLFALTHKNQSAEVHEIRLSTTSSEQRTISLYVSTKMVNGEFSDDILITNYGFLLDAGEMSYPLDHAIQISEETTFKGICDVADVVHFIVFGILKE